MGRLHVKFHEDSCYAFGTILPNRANRVFTERRTDRHGDFSIPLTSCAWDIMNVVLLLYVTVDDLSIIYCISYFVRGVLISQVLHLVLICGVFFAKDSVSKSFFTRGLLVGCCLTSHSAIFQLYSDGTVVQFPNFDLLPGTQRHGQLGVFSMPSLPRHGHRDFRRRL